jgi:hypothetical protein
MIICCGRGPVHVYALAFFLECSFLCIPSRYAGRNSLALVPQTGGLPFGREVP